MKSGNGNSGGFAASAAVLGAGVLWGVINLFVRTLSAEGLSALQISMVRMIVSAAVVWGGLLLFDRKHLRVRVRDLWMFAGTGIVSIVLFNVFYFDTMINGQASVAVVLLYTSPVFVMLLSALLFRERITARRLIALVLTVAGCAAVAGLFSAGNVSAGNAAVISPRILLTGLASGLFYALYTIFGRVALRHYDSLTVTAYTFLFGTAGSVVFGHPVEAGRTFAAHPYLIGFGVGIGVVCTVLPYFLYTWGLARMPSGKAAILVAVEPLVGAVLGMTVFGEDHSLPKLSGIALILASILLLGTEIQEPAGQISSKNKEDDPT